ncbi:AAA-type ATPase lid domain-containing protein [Schnuerera ultunensis]
MFDYSWSGNVRELQHIIESSINFAQVRWRYNNKSFACIFK